MKNYEFPLLKPYQIEVRVGQVTKSGYTLLLYKTARTDAEILDEVVGMGNWQKKFYVCGETLFCSVGIYDEDKHEWVWKDDAGDESQVEKVKGEASDAFKRASGGSCWGIGRELYYTGFLFIKGGVTTDKNDNRKYVLDDEHKYKRLSVKEIEWNKEPLSIKKLVIVDENGEIMLEKGNYKSSSSKPSEPKRDTKPYQQNIADIHAFLNQEKGSATEEQKRLINSTIEMINREDTRTRFFAKMEAQFGTSSVDMLSEYQAYDLLEQIKAKSGK